MNFIYMTWYHNAYSNQLLSWWLKQINNFFNPLIWIDLVYLVFRCLAILGHHTGVCQRVFSVVQINYSINRLTTINGKAGMENHSWPEQICEHFTLFSELWFRRLECWYRACIMWNVTVWGPLSPNHTILLVNWVISASNKPNMNKI